MLSTLKVCIDQRLSELFFNSHTRVPYCNISFPLASPAGFLMAKMHFMRYIVFMMALWTSELEISASLISPADVRPSVLSSKTYGEKEETDIMKTCHKTYWSWTPCRPSSHHKDNIFLWTVSRYSCRNVPNVSMNDPSSSPSFGPSSYMYLLQPSASFIHWCHSRYLSPVDLVILSGFLDFIF